MGLFSTDTFYVKIKKNQFIIKSIKRQETIVVDATTPFTTKRLLIGELSVAEALLKSSFTKLINGFIKPKVVMHPLEYTEGGLSEVEEKILKGLAIVAGARDPKIWVGEELSDKDIEV
jgi:rod shape-determining protein MreB